MSEARVGLVIEDDQDIRELVRVVLSQAGFDVHVASTGSAGVNSARELNPDVITLDLGLPDIDGFEVARQIRKTSDAYIIMLTARAEELDTLMGLEAGGDDYLTKPFRPRELRARVEAMMRRPRSSSDAKHAPEAADPEMTHNGLAVSAGSRTAVLNGMELKLTRTEFDLLAHLVRNPGVVVAREDLMRAVWATEFVPDSTHVVDVHLANLRRKLRKAASGNEWIRTIRGVGFRYDPCCP